MFALDTVLKEMGFSQSENDPYRNTAGEMLYIGVYVDDINLKLAGKMETRLKEVNTYLSRRFGIKDPGELNYFLGIRIEQRDNSESVWIGQPEYTRNLLETFGMQHCKPVGTPVSSGVKLSKVSHED